MVPYQVLPLRDSMDLGVMAMKGYSSFPKLQHYWSLNIRFFVSYQGHSLGESYPSVVYFAVPADWARQSMTSNDPFAPDLRSQ